MLLSTNAISAMTDFSEDLSMSPILLTLTVSRLNTPAPTLLMLVFIAYFTISNLSLSHTGLAATSISISKYASRPKSKYCLNFSKRLVMDIHTRSYSPTTNVSLAVSAPLKLASQCSWQYVTCTST